MKLSAKSDPRVICVSENLFRCSECNKEYNTKNKVQIHFNQTHVPEIKKKNSLRSNNQRTEVRRLRTDEENKAFYKKEYQSRTNTVEKKRKRVKDNYATTVRRIQQNLELGVVLKCYKCEYQTHSGTNLRHHIAYTHKYAKYSVTTRKLRERAVKNFFVKLEAVKYTMDVVEFNSQEEGNAGKLMGEEYVVDLYDTLSVPLTKSKHWIYYLIMVDPIKMKPYKSLLEYLRKTDGDKDHEKYSYVGKKAEMGASDYHTDPKLKSTVRTFCIEKKLVCYLVANLKFTGPNAKKLAETGEFFFQLVGQLQLRNTYTEYKMINKRLERAAAITHDTLTKNLIAQANHLALIGQPMICIKKGCTTKHNEKMQFEFYGNHHVDEEKVTLVLDGTTLPPDLPEDQMFDVTEFDE